MSFAGSGSPIRLAASIVFALGAFGLSSSSVGQVEAGSPAPATQAAIEDDMVFLAGEQVVVSHRTTDDLFAAGSMVEANGASADHLFLAGREITVSQAQASDVIAAGGEIRLNRASVTDDLIVAGGEIVAGRGFDVGGTAVITGGNVRFEAPVGKDLRIGAGEIFVNSAIGGTARLSGDTIVLGPNARIAGDLLYQSENLTVDPAAVIEGNRTALPASDGHAAEDFGKGAGRFFLLFGLSMMVSYFVIVALLVLAAPKLMRSTSQMLQSRPWQALGIGVLYALIVPMLGFILLWTVVGIPLAVLLFVASLALTPIAIAVSVHFIGMAARKLITRKSGPDESMAGRIGWPLSGVVILFALALIPLVGMLVLLLAMLFGLGAFTKQVADALSAPADAPATA